MKKHSPNLYFLFLSTFLVLGLSVWAGIRFGAVTFPSEIVLWEIRLPRVILALSVGAGLAVAGACLQVLFSNPLCEPYTMGVASGAALGAVLGGSLSFFGSALGLNGGAFVGALFFGFLLFLLASQRRVSQLGLLLVGIMLSLVASSFLALWLAMTDPHGIQGVLSWLLGDLSRARIETSLFSFIVIAFLSVLVWTQSSRMDRMMMGEENARGLGVSVHQMRKRLIFLSSLIVALAVSGAGIIGFIGLMIPHFTRRVVGSLHFVMLPVAFLWGAIALIWGDLAARMILRPEELPVGVVTALIGAPVFILMMLQQSRQKLR
jgi:iron complex transport system permease protein